MRWKSIPAHFFICSPRIIAASLLVSKLSASAPGFVRYSGACASLRSAPAIPERGAGGTRRKTWATASGADGPNPLLLPRPCVALGGRGMAPHRGPLPRAPGLRGRSPPLRRAFPPGGWFAAPSARKVKPPAAVLRNLALRSAALGGRPAPPWRGLRLPLLRHPGRGQARRLRAARRGRFSPPPGFTRFPVGCQG